MFRLVNLPILAIRQVIRSMEFREIFFLSLVSKLSKTLIRTLLAKNSITVYFELSFQRIIRLRNFELEVREGLSGGLSIEPRRICYTCPLNEKESTMKFLIQYFLDIFNHPFVFIEFRYFVEPSLCLEVLKMINKQGARLKTVHYKIDRTSSEEVFAQTMKECAKVRTELVLATELPIGYRFPGVEGLGPDRLIVHFCPEAYSLQSFLECKSIEMYGYKMGEDLRDLLQVLKDSEEANLKKVTLHLKGDGTMNFEEIVGEDSLRQADNSQYAEIQKRDGRKMRVAQSSRLFTINETKKLEKLD